MGHSDFTAFQLAALAHAGMTTFAGPMAAYDFGAAMPSAFTLDHCWDLLESRRYEIECALDGPDFIGDGTLWGGNLAMVAHLAGTPHMPRVENGILFLEDIGEHPYRIERMLHQLDFAGVLSRQRAVLLGSFSGYDLGPNDNGYDAAAMVEHVRTRLSIPVYTGLPFGHCPEKLTLPVGGHCATDRARRPRAARAQRLHAESLGRTRETAKRYSTSPIAVPRGSNVALDEVRGAVAVDGEHRRAARSVGLADDERRREQPFAIERYPGRGQLVVGRAASCRRASRTAGRGPGRPARTMRASAALVRATFGHGVSSAAFERPWIPGASARVASARFEPQQASRTVPATRLKPLQARAHATTRATLPDGGAGSASTAGTSAPRDGAFGSCRDGSRTLVTNAHRASRVTPNQVPPALMSRPASQPASHQAAGAAGRAWYSSRLAATTSANSGCASSANSARHMRDRAPASTYAVPRGLPAGGMA